MSVSIDKRPKAIQLRRIFGHFEVDTIKIDKVRGDVLAIITERLSQQHITTQVSGCNSQAVTMAIIKLL